MNLKDRILRSSVARLVAEGVALTISFFMVPFVLRSLGDHQYGLWVILAAFGSYYYFDFGLSMATGRFVTMRMAAKDEAGVNQVVSTALVLFSGVAMLVALVVVATAAILHWFARPEDVFTLRVVLLINGFAVVSSFPANAYAGITYGEMRHDLVERMSVIRRIAEGVVVYWALSNGYGLIAYAVIFAASSLVGSLYCYWVARRLWPPLAVGTAHYSRALSRELFRFGGWTTLNHVSAILRNKIDALVIGATIGSAAVAHYNVGLRLSDLAVGLLYRATDFTAALFARYFAVGDRAKMQSYLLALTRVNAYLAFTGGMVLIVVGDAFIRRWTGTAYADAYAVMVTLMTGRMFEAAAVPAGNALYASERLRVPALVDVGEAIANLTLSLVLVQRMGILGIAIGTAVPMLAARLVIIPWYVCRSVELPASRYYAGILPSFALSVALAGLVHLAVRPYLVDAGYPQIALVAGVAGALIGACHVILVFTTEERRSVGTVAAMILPRSSA